MGVRPPIRTDRERAIVKWPRCGPICGGKDEGDDDGFSGQQGSDYGHGYRYDRGADDQRSPARQRHERCQPHARRTRRFEGSACAALPRRGRPFARRAAHRFRQGYAQGPLFAARRNLPGFVRARRLGLCRRCGTRAAALQLHFAAVVHARDAGAVERRHRARSAHLLLPQLGARQPQRHRRYLERECLACVARRRDRHLLGQCPRHRRAGWPQRQDLGHHPVRARDGFADAGDQPGLAAARVGGGLSRRVAPRDRGIPRNPQTLGRFQPQGAQPAPRRVADRRLHGSGPRGR